MALASQYTLADARAEVMTRLGFADQGTAVTRGVKRINSFIQQATNELAVEVGWTDSRFELFIPLITGQDRYEFPDETKIGDFTLEVVDKNGRRYSMAGGIQTQDWLGDSTDPELLAKIGQPVRWRVVDREIQIIPAPTDVFTRLAVFYSLRVPIYRDDGDLLPFDSEVIIQRAVILGKVHYQQPGVQEAMMMHVRYTARIIAKQGPGRVFNVGGRQSHYMRVQRVPLSGGNAGNVGPNVEYSDGWNPW
jgi:hypothetical protein